LAVEWCLRWQREGLQAPSSVRDATSAYQAKMDPVGAFIRACCIEDPAATIPFGTLFTAYKRWCKGTGRTASSDRALAKGLSEKGIKPRTGTGGKHFRVGLRLREDDPSAGAEPGENAQPDDDGEVGPDEQPFIVGEGLLLGRRRAAKPQDHGP
jgi:phage/plasmid-associated DNA primase